MKSASLFASLAFFASTAQSIFRRIQRSVGFAAVAMLVLASSTCLAQTGGWVWMGGGSTIPGSNYGNHGIYGTLGAPATGNIPGGREYSAYCTDARGNFWIFGGYGYDSAGSFAGYLNDLWVFNPSTNEWTWMGGSSTHSGFGLKGVYGTSGVSAPGNVPGGRGRAICWVDRSGNLWLFGGSGYDSNGSFGSLNDLWQFNPASGLWTWVAGSNSLPNGYLSGQAGVYGTLGTPAVGNTPGARSEAVVWTDSNGNFWLFGGTGFDSVDSQGSLNDLWELNPSTGQWAWISGSNTVGSSGSQVGVYGTQGVPALGNIPGGRSGATAWADSDGNLWLFGGSGSGASAAGLLADLWTFSPSTLEWTWMGGSNAADLSGSYGMIGVPSTANAPGARDGASSWTGGDGNLWLFGGYGYAAGNRGWLNDLWEFSQPTSEWTWITGSNSIGGDGGQPGVYGTQGVIASGNIPGSREGAANWIDAHGNLWFFGGYGYIGPSTSGYLNDVWEYQPVVLPPASAPTFSVAAGTYTAAQQVTLTDTTSNATIYYTTNGSKPTTASAVYSGPITVSTSETIEAIATAANYSQSPISSATYTITPLAAPPTFSLAPGAYTTPQAVSIADSTPGATIYYTINGTTPTSSSTVYSGPITVSVTGTIKAIATSSGYTSSAAVSATYIIEAAAPVFSAAPGTYATPVTLTITEATPGATILYSANGASWTKYTAPLTVTATETLEAFAIAGGYYNSALASATYTIGQPVSAGAWTWMSGSSTVPLAADGYTALSPLGVYGTMGVAEAGDVPGGRSSANTWKDRGSNLWIFGGYGTDSVGTSGYLNDLWEFNPASGEWGWMSGSSTITITPSGFNCQPGVYGSLGVPALGNVPGGRQNATSWTDSQGNFWLFGGYGCDSQGIAGVELDDLWEFNPSSNEWTWIGGSNTGAWIPSVYGTLGVPAPGNTPGARDSAASWTDAHGNLWLFGGFGAATGGQGIAAGALNDLWEFSPSTLEWSWMGGSTSTNSGGSYGTLGIPSTANLPGSRSGAASWTDAGGNLWLFGGGGFTPSNTSTGNQLNDLWMFSPNTLQWTWISGSNNTIGTQDGQPGVYGTPGIPAAGNVPGGRAYSTSWVDLAGNLWLTGGTGIDSTGKGGELNDLWEFNPLTLQWTWMSGSGIVQAGQYNCTDNGTICGQDGVYGSLAAYGGFPGGRQFACSWTDSSGDFWLFGGFGFDAFGKASNMNDLWRYEPPSVTLLPAATPTFSVSPGVYTASQTVAISDATTGAMIYYTLDGSTPSTSSMAYSGAITVSSTETLNAIAVANGYGSSAIASAKYTIMQTPAIGWTTPAAITYGTALGSAQLDASSTVGGTFSYSPAAGTVLGAGAQTLSVTFTPSDTTDYTSATATVPLAVNQAAQSIAFAPLASPVTYGLGPIALTATSTSSLPVAFSVASGPGMVNGSLLAVTGAGTIVVMANQAGNSNYAAAVQVTQSIVVNMATQTITFTPPSSVAYGVSPFTLTATASSGLPVMLNLVSGPASLSGNLLTIMSAGTVSLRATQAGNANYQTASPVSASITVTKGTPSISWSTPAPIVYGAALSSAQLNATSPVAGTLAYTPAANKVLAAGTHTLSVTFTPSNLTDYLKVTATVQLIVQRATPAITWSNPAAISYGKGLSSTQLDAKASVGGAFGYTPSAGTILDVGTYALTATFTPTSANYATATASVQLTVKQASQTISFPQPASPVSHTAPPTTLTATASSGLPVSFTVQSGPAKVSGNTLTLTGGTGTVVVVSNQAGNSNYLAAAPVSRSIKVN
jgi:N-acetylneuraminic acid mutarotase